jgi:hypothetical protein
LLSPHSSLVDSACSISNNTESAYQSQKTLQSSTWNNTSDKTITRTTAKITTPS